MDIKNYCKKCERCAISKFHHLKCTPSASEPLECIAIDSSMLEKVIITRWVAQSLHDDLGRLLAKADAETRISPWVSSAVKSPGSVFATPTRILTVLGR